MYNVDDTPVRSKNNNASMTKVMTDMMGEEKKPVQVECPPPPDQKSITISAPAGFNISTEGGPDMNNKITGIRAELSKKSSAPNDEQQGGKKSKKHRRFKLRKRTRKRNRLLKK